MPKPVTSVCKNNINPLLPDYFTNGILLQLSNSSTLKI